MLVRDFFCSIFAFNHSQTMKRIILSAVVIAAVFTSCNSDKKETNSFSELTSAYFDEKNFLNPIEATFNGQEKYNDLLQLDMTDGFRAKQLDFYNKYEQAILKIDTTNLDTEEKISYEIIQWEVSVGKQLLSQPANLLPLQQFSGTHLAMAQLAGATSSQPFKTEKDYNNFLKRMETYGVWLDSAVVYMRKGISQNVVLPQALTEKMIPQFDEMVTQNVEDNIFYSAIKVIPSDFSDSAKKGYASKYKKVIEEQLVPRFKNMSAFLKNEYLPASRSTSGIGALPFGNQLYTAYARQWTTTEMTPDEIHNLGLKEVARITKEMEIVKAQVGFKGTIAEFFNHVRDKKELKPFTKPEEVIANFEAIHNKIKPNVAKLFSLTPKTPFEVRRTEAFREKTASAEYVPGAADGSRPGIFYVPIPDITNYTMYADEDLFLHEAIPGHHYQVSLQQENDKLPDFRKFNWFGAYGEGWALYTESLGKELGLYQDPYQYFGMLSSEMHRAIRLVVDTGMHSKGWTREQAITYSLENEAEPEASIIAEIERYMAIPGQALSYKIGQLKIMDLRQRAETQLGKKFDIKKFHAIVLESGNMPLALLEKKVNKWIASVK